MSRKKKAVFSIILIALLMAFLELFCRIEWSLRSEVPFFSGNLYFYYPELKPLTGDRSEEEAGFEILLLGGSVLHEDWGNIPRALKERIARVAGKDVRLYNLARPGHTSLDSYYKYKRLGARTFDLVVLYHGINELRLNNCPPGVYRPDYGHYSWYRIINRFEGHPRWPDLASHYALSYRFIRLHEKLIDPGSYIPRDRPAQDMMRFGGDIKTAGAFETNIKRIIGLARDRKEPLALMTFSYHLDEKYSLEKFENGSLDYCLHSCPVEIWGTPANIVSGLEVHNRIIRDIESQSPGGTVFVDQEGLIPKNGIHFNDICHLTHIGCSAFAENILRALPRGILAGKRAGSEDSR